MIGRSAAARSREVSTGGVRTGVAALILVVAVLVLAEPAQAVSVQDMLGRRVQVPERPTRIVSLAPSMTEMVFAIGAADRLVGVSDFCDFPAEAMKKPRIGGIYTPNLEAILSLRPDLVLATSEGNREEHIQGLERLRIPVYVVRPLDYLTVIESIERVGRVLREEEGANRLTSAMRHEAESVARAVAGASRPRVLYVVWGNPLIVPGRDTLITDLIRRAGGESVTGDEPLPYPRLAVEEAMARNPDWIVIGQHADMSVEARLRQWEALTLLPAVRQGRVRPIDGDLMHRPGPRIVEGLRGLARIIHPGRMPP